MLVVGNRARYIRYDEDRLDADDATHTEIIESSLPAACPSGRATTERRSFLGPKRHSRAGSGKALG